MSFVTDHVRRIDAQLDRLQLASIEISAAVSPSKSRHDPSQDAPAVAPSPRISTLQAIVKSLSTTATSKALRSPTTVLALLHEADLLSGRLSEDPPNDAARAYEHELQWLVISKATVQTYGLILDSLIRQTIPLTDDIWYWDDVLGSYRYTALYSVQTSPIRLWSWSKDIYSEARRRLESLHTQLNPLQPGNTADEPNDTNKAASSVTDRWKEFYGLVRDSIRDRSISDIQRRVISPFALSRVEAKTKQSRLRKLREMSASSLGVLMDEGLTFEIDDEGNVVTKDNNERSESLDDKEEWKGIVEKSVALMETVLQDVTNLEMGVVEFEEAVFATVDNDPQISESSSSLDKSVRQKRPAVLSTRLQQILQVHIPAQAAASKALAKEHGRPSVLVRYWMPMVVVLLSSSVTLRFALNRKDAIIKWFWEAGETAVEFWTNWVVEPTKKLIGTIRHDEDSEIAIMSKHSLEGDRDSLERMVVDFAIDNPMTNEGKALSESAIAAIREKVKEGDLTPVLRAYEKDLRKPFMGTLRGDLIRALLIQIQKTKVDVEVALGGIDALLKSQELVFGFVGLTPGILVCVGTARWLGGVFGSRGGRRKGKQQTQMVRLLRNIDRILTASTAPNNGMLSYQEHGLLLCEVHILRQRAAQVFPSEINREFVEDIRDLINIGAGVKRQLMVVSRIRWTYGKWMQ